jgi:hypothetical protein
MKVAGSTRNRFSALEHLLAGATISDAAAKVKVSRRTVWRWRRWREAAMTPIRDSNKAPPELNAA